MPELMGAYERVFGTCQIAGAQSHHANLARRQTRVPKIDLTRFLARLLRFAFPSFPVAAHDVNAGAMGSTVAREPGHAQVGAGAFDSLGPFQGALVVERIEARADRAAVNDAGREGAELPSRGARHGLVEQRPGFVAPTQRAQ